MSRIKIVEAALVVQDPVQQRYEAKGGNVISVDKARRVEAATSSACGENPSLRALSDIGGFM